jgi:hypothetical protein
MQGKKLPHKVFVYQSGIGSDSYLMVEFIPEKCMESPDDHKVVGCYQLVEMLDVQSTTTVKTKKIK